MIVMPQLLQLVNILNKRVIGFFDDDATTVEYDGGLSAHSLIRLVL